MTAVPGRIRPVTRWRSADHRQRRELILGVALDLLRRRGLEAVTMRNVARRLGVGAMTLYTYINGQDELRRAMARRGFEMLHHGCEAASTLDNHKTATPGHHEAWRGGARHYLQFALDNPNLYHLMFSVHPAEGGADDSILMGGLQHLINKVEQHTNNRSLDPRERQLHVRANAGRFWIALHGLASLAIAGRLSVLGGDIEQLLDDLLERVAPD